MRIDECELTADGSHYRGIAVDPASGSRFQFVALSNGQIVLAFQQTEMRANSSVVWCRIETPAALQHAVRKRLAN